MDKEALFRPRVPMEIHEIPDVGAITVRGLDRSEALAISKIEDVAERDAQLIAIGMVEPSLSVSEVKRWGKAATGGELESVSEHIARLSGMLPDSAKQAVREFEADPDSEFRVPPSGEARHDKGTAPRRARQR